MRGMIGAMLVLAGACTASAGDYMLLIANHPDLPCGKAGAGGQALVPSKSNWTVRSGPQVADQVARYFRGEENDAVLLFRDGHFLFCGRDERGSTYRALVDAAALEAPRHEDHLYFLAGLPATCQFNTLLDQRLAEVGSDTLARHRLERMKTQVGETLRRLTTRCS